MGLFVRGLGKPGKGIDPDAPQKRGFFKPLRFPIHS